MEYEKVRKSCVCMCVYASKRQRKCVCLFVLWNTQQENLGQEVCVIIPPPPLPLFLFLFRKGTVCCTRGSTTPGTLLWCKPESNSGALCRKHARTHTRAFTDVHELTLWFMFRASKQRRKADRIVLECQEQAYWLINRPPVRSITLYCIQLYCAVHATLQHNYMIMSILGNYAVSQHKNRQQSH